MSRGLSGPQVALTTAAHRIVVPLIELYFDSGTVRLAINQWSVTAGANTYQATGPLLSVEAIKESVNSIEGLRLALSGLDPSIIVLATSEPYSGRLAQILKAYVDPANNAVVGTLQVAFPARMRSMAISETNDKASVGLTLEHYDAEFERINPLRWSNGDQQRLFPGDRGCEHVDQMTERNIIWPSKEALQHP